MFTFQPLLYGQPLQELHMPKDPIGKYLWRVAVITSEMKLVSSRVGHNIVEASELENPLKRSWLRDLRSQRQLSKRLRSISPVPTRLKKVDSHLDLHANYLDLAGVEAERFLHSRKKVDLDRVLPLLKKAKRESTLAYAEMQPFLRNIAPG